MAQFGFGSGQMFGIRTDIATQTPVLFGTMQDVSVDFDGEIKELFGQSQYPVDTARGKTKITGKSKFATIDAQVYNNLFFGATRTAGTQNKVATETDAIGASVTVTNSATFIQDLGVVRGDTGAPMTLVASSPATGQYSVAAGVYSFASADVSSAFSVTISYEYTTSTGAIVTITNQLMGTTPKWKGIFSMIYGGKSLVLTLNQCTSSKLTLATKIDDYTIPEMDFSAFSDSAGNVGTLAAAN